MEISFNLGIILQYHFDTSPERLFKTYTDPRLIPEWWGPSGLTTEVEKMDVRPGGSWRYIQHDGDGNEFAFHGVYQEVLPSERLVFTFEYEGTPGHSLLEALTFEGQNGKTKLIDKMLFQSVEDRDGMLSSGVEEGATETMQRLAELLARN